MSWPSFPTCLTAPVKISGEPIVNLIASTSGTDSDWVVKVIDRLSRTKLPVNRAWAVIS